jgi:hypothetical protein
MRRRALLAASQSSGGGGGGNLIIFYIDGIECVAEDGMRFYDWILSDYFDTTNPYNLAGLNLDNVNFREFIREYGLDYPNITTGGGIYFTPRIYADELIIPNQSYVLCTPGGSLDYYY